MCLLRLDLYSSVVASWEDWREENMKREEAGERVRGSVGGRWERSS